jgi:hypothetical protein
MKNKLINTWVAASNVGSVAFGIPAWATNSADRIIVSGDLVHSAATASLSFRPNGLTTNQTGITSIWFGGGGSFASSATTVLQIASFSEADTVACSFRLTFKIKTGFVRYFESQSLSFTSTTPRTERRCIDTGFWNDAATPVTSFTLHCNTGAINSGSVIKVWAETEPGLYT